MKPIITKKALEQAVERAMKARYLVDTGVIGTSNMVLLQFESESYCEAWITDNAISTGSHPRFQAFGDHVTGEVLISSFGDHPSLHLIGKGHKEQGQLLLIQRTGEVFTVVWNSDLEENRSVFFMTATDDKLLIQLITYLAEKHFPSIKSEDVQQSLSSLMGGSNDE